MLACLRWRFLLGCLDGLYSLNVREAKSVSPKALCYKWPFRVRVVEQLLGQSKGGSVVLSVNIADLTRFENWAEEHRIGFLPVFHDSYVISCCDLLRFKSSRRPAISCRIQNSVVLSAFPRSTNAKPSRRRSLPSNSSSLPLGSQSPPLCLVKITPKHSPDYP